MTIKDIQLLLRAKGYAIDADGIPGKNTTGAIIDFQRKSGLQPDGIAGKDTIAALQKPLVTVPRPVVTTPVTGTLDSVNAAKIANLHPSIREKVTRAVLKANARLTGRAQVRIVQGYRTFEEQNALYNQPFDHKDNDGDGRVDESDEKVTQAKGGQSIHNYGLAIDFALLIDGKQISWDTKADFDGDKVADWLEVVAAFEEEGGLWGGKWSSFKDLPHIEFVHDWKPLLAKYNKGDFIPGTKYVNL